MTGMVVAIALSVPLAYLSWRFVEGPFRKPARKGGYSQRAIFTMSLTGIAAMMLLGGGIIKNVVQLPYQIPSKVTASFARLDPASNCFDVAEAHNSDKSFCSIGDTKRAPDFLLLGDSHGLSLKQAFDDAGRQTGRAGLFIGYSGCPPLLDLVPDRNDQERHDCAALTRFAFNTAATRGLRDVVLVARWDYYIGSDGHTANGTLQYLGERGGSPATSLDQNRRILADAMARTVEFARRRGLTLHVIEQVPHQNHGPQSVYYAAARGGARLVEEQSLSRADYLAQIAPARRLFMPFTNGPAASVRYHADIDTLCKASLCPVGTPEHSYYFDDDHLSLIGAARLRPMAERALRAP